MLQNRLQKWDNVVFSEEPRLCVLYSDERMHFWIPREDHTSLASTLHWHREPGPGVVAWASYRYTTLIHLVGIDGNYSADIYISEILDPVVVSFIRGLPNTIFRKNNARLHVAHRVLTFLGTKDIRLPPWSVRSSHPLVIERIYGREKLACHIFQANTVYEGMINVC